MGYHRLPPWFLACTAPRLGLPAPHCCDAPCAASCRTGTHRTPKRAPVCCHSRTSAHAHSLFFPPKPLRSCASIPCRASMQGPDSTGDGSHVWRRYPATHKYSRVYSLSGSFISKLPGLQSEGLNCRAASLQGFRLHKTWNDEFFTRPTDCRHI